MMLALPLHAYCLGERSSRRIEQRCRHDIASRVMTANRVPDHATIARFRVRHEPTLKGLLVQSLRLRQAAGLVSVGVLAVDPVRDGAGHRDGAPFYPPKTSPKRRPSVTSNDCPGAAFVQFSAKI